ncbi:major facilitator superfamily domain-containing protein [Aspergillus spectabilis]
MADIGVAVRFSVMLRGTVDDVAFEGIPGTRLLIEHTDAEVVLLPHPTSSPNDPLNWDWRRKYTAQAILGATSGYLNIGSALALLMLGVGNLLFNPMALKFGRRPIYLASALISAASQVVIATAQNKATFTGARVLLGFGAAPFEQLPALSVDDQFFVHQRGLGLSIYTLAITSGSFLGPIATGFVIDSMMEMYVSPLVRSNPFILTTTVTGVYWFYAIFIFAIATLVFFGLEATGFPRRAHESAPEEEPHDTIPARKTYHQKLKLITNLLGFFAGPIMGAGLILYGVGAAHRIHWSGPIIGMGMIGSALPISAEVALGYVSESYPSLAGEATTAVIVIRNVIGGLQDTFVVVGVLAFVVFVSGGRLGAKRYYAMVAMKR